MFKFVSGFIDQWAGVIANFDLDSSLFKLKMQNVLSHTSSVVTAVTCADQFSPVWHSSGLNLPRGACSIQRQSVRPSRMAIWLLGIGNTLLYCHIATLLSCWHIRCLSAPAGILLIISKGMHCTMQSAPGNSPSLETNPLVISLQGDRQHESDYSLLVNSHIVLLSLCSNGQNKFVFFFS